MRRLIVIVSSIALALAMASTAQATPPTGGGSVAGYTQAQVAASFLRVEDGLRTGAALSDPLDRQVKASVENLARQTASLGTARLTFAGGSASPDVWGGWDGGGPYLVFNSFEQDLIISGWGFALATAICLVPGVGQAACVVSGAIITVLTVFLSHNRKCPAGAKVYINRLGQVGSAVCVR